VQNFCCLREDLLDRLETVVDALIVLRAAVFFTVETRVVNEV
jgi:hypothetical protein